MQINEYFMGLYPQRPVLEFEIDKPINQTQIYSRLSSNFIANSPLQKQLHYHKKKVAEMVQYKHLNVPNQLLNDFLNDQQRTLSKLPSKLKLPSLSLNKVRVKQVERKRESVLQSERNSYNRWYMPSQCKFKAKIKTPNYKKEIAQDPNFLYKNIGRIRIWEDLDPFKQPSEAKPQVCQSDQLMIRKVLKQYKEDTAAKGQRLPIFVRELLQQKAS